MGNGFLRYNRIIPVAQENAGEPGQSYQDQICQNTDGLRRINAIVLNALLVSVRHFDFPLLSPSQSTSV